MMTKTRDRAYYVYESSPFKTSFMDVETSNKDVLFPSPLWNNPVLFFKENPRSVVPRTYIIRVYLKSQKFQKIRISMQNLINGLASICRVMYKIEFSAKLGQQLGSKLS